MKKIILLLASVSFLTGIFFVSQIVYKQNQEARRAKVVLAKRTQAWIRLKSELGRKVWNFKGVVGVEIKDLETNWTISYNERTALPSASLVKIPILLSYFLAEKEGVITFNEQLSLSASDRVGGSKVLGNESVGSIFTVEELFGPMIALSDNAAANMLTNFLGFDRLNGYFAKMGLKDTNIARLMLDFEKRKEGVENYTTAADMRKLLESLYYRRFVNKHVSERCLSILSGQKINDRIPRKLPKNGIQIAHKTGLERHICHDVGIVFTPKGDFLICVLVKHRYKFAEPAKKFISDVAVNVFNYYQSF